MKKNWMDKNWDSLNSIMRFIESGKVKGEKVVSFNGYLLTTNKYEYGLSAGRINRRKLR